MEAINLHTLELRNETDVVVARKRAREIAERLGFEVQDQTRIATACSEIARNAVRYAGAGKVEFAVEAEVPQVLRIVTSDSGPGIEDTKKILAGRYRSSTGMGLGIIGAKRLMDGFELTSSKGVGTRVVLKKRLPGKREFTETQIAGIRTAVKEHAIYDPWLEAEQQNRELLNTLQELKDRQSELERLNQELDDTNRGVVALYAELDERAGLLQRTSDLKSRFLSNMSHEFRTPLNSILSLCQILLQRMDGDLSAEQEKQVVYVKRSAETLLDLVNDLLDLAKIEAGKVVVRAEEFSIASIFGALRGMLKPLITNPEVVLIFEEAADVPHLVSDESKISQILRNFISNALKFTERGEVRVTAKQAPHDSIVFEVEDTGIGIAEEDRERIFEEFTQVENALQKRAKGTGLGLPLTRKLAELLGGEVGVRSKLGKGSTFVLTVPRIYAEPVKTVVAEIATGGEPPKVLVVDDEPVSRYLLKGLLPSNLRVIEAEGGRAGILLAKEQMPSLIFLDLVMPDYTGHDFLRDLSKDAATADIPVVIHTSKVLDADERTMLLRQAIDIVPKESPSREIAVERVRNALQKAGLAIAVAEGR
jgi:signal transduction histidine kinase/CheY-like chemotaxis protein